jgi:hypothetical protein
VDRFDFTEFGRTVSRDGEDRRPFLVGGASGSGVGGDHLARGRVAVQDVLGVGSASAR